MSHFMFRHPSRQSLSLNFILNAFPNLAPYVLAEYSDKFAETFMSDIPTKLLAPSYATHFLSTCVNIWWNPLGGGQVFRSRNLVFFVLRKTKQNFLRKKNYVNNFLRKTRFRLRNAWPPPKGFHQMFTQVDRNEMFGLNTLHEWNVWSEYPAKT